MVVVVVLESTERNGSKPMKQPWGLARKRRCIAFVNSKRLQSTWSQSQAKSLSGLIDKVTYIFVFLITINETYICL